MVRLIGFCFGAISGGTAGLFLGVLLFSDSLTHSDGLDAGFAWMYTIILSAIAATGGCIVGSLYAPQIAEYLRPTWDEIRKELRRNHDDESV